MRWFKVYLKYWRHLELLHHLILMVSNMVITCSVTSLLTAMTTQLELWTLVAVNKLKLLCRKFGCSFAESVTSWKNLAVLSKLTSVCCLSCYFPISMHNQVLPGREISMHIWGFINCSLSMSSIMIHNLLFFCFLFLSFGWYRSSIIYHTVVDMLCNVTVFQCIETL